MPAYDATRFDPPAPLAQVTLRHPGNGATRLDVPMLLDSGADVTLIPKTVIELLGATIVPGRQMDRAWGILGRNVLNAIPILLDGPHLEWDEHRPG